jgi:uncharacterized membrane protein
MVSLCIGLVLWMDAHFFKRLLPGLRQSLNERIGAGPARGVMSVIILLSVILMIVGYRAAPVHQVYDPIAGMGHLNNLLMVISVVMLGMGSSKGRMRTWFRHPMLMGIIVWGTAHLLVNGDLASIILFGGMILWALGEIFLINKQEGAWDRPAPGPASSDIKLLVISAVVFVVIVSIHMALGYNPFLGSYA